MALLLFLNAERDIDVLVAVAVLWEVVPGLEVSVPGFRWSRERRISAVGEHPRESRDWTMNSSSLEAKTAPSGTKAAGCGSKHVSGETDCDFVRDFDRVPEVVDRICPCFISVYGTSNRNPVQWWGRWLLSLLQPGGRSGFPAPLDAPPFRQNQHAPRGYYCRIPWLRNNFIFEKIFLQTGTISSQQM